LLDQAQDDATILAVRDQERAGIDVVTDGEIRRESYSNRFATALEGMDSDHPAEVPSRIRTTAIVLLRAVSYQFQSFVNHGSISSFGFTTRKSRSTKNRLTMYAATRMPVPVIQ